MTSSLPPDDLVGADLAGTASVGCRPADVGPDHDVDAANRSSMKRIVVMDRMEDSSRLQCAAVLDSALCPEAVIHWVHVACSPDLTSVVRTAATFGLLALDLSGSHGTRFLTSRVAADLALAVGFQCGEGERRPGLNPCAAQGRAAVCLRRSHSVKPSPGTLAVGVVREADGPHTEMHDQCCIPVGARRPVTIGRAS